ncbi:MerR family transcriptional regulator [Streptomyces sp. NBC_01186]|uniref:MerR family transcriptional regulator n=1 Tax=Streptomyces sp. NBC_01186 TaxID=2903765 RepID=UPI002E137326
MDPAEAELVATEGPEALPDLAAHLSQGFTAWLGVVHGAEVRPGDTVFVSGAAGGVGSLAGQFARLRGAARVIGSTGSPHKAGVLTGELGYDAVVLRGSGTSIEDQLREAAPDGVDAVLDNVGGEQLAAALAVARHGARVCVLGSLSTQVSGGLSASLTLDSFSLPAKALTLRGIRGFDHLDRLPLWRREFAEGLRSGKLTVPRARVSGIQEAPARCASCWRAVTSVPCWWRCEPGGAMSGPGTGGAERAGMRIGDAAAAVGVTPRALRYYEQRGLLTPQRAPSGHREYGSGELSRLRVVRGLLAAGLTIEDVADILRGFPAAGPGPGCGVVLEVVQRRLDDLDGRIRRLTELRPGWPDSTRTASGRSFRPAAGIRTGG